MRTAGWLVAPTGTVEVAMTVEVPIMCTGPVDRWSLVPAQVTGLVVPSATRDGIVMVAGLHV